MPAKASRHVMYVVSKVVVLLYLLLSAASQQDFTTRQVPNPFRVGNMYPPRSERDVCRPIEDHIYRSSARFRSQLVTNTNPNIIFATSDSRIMSSRLQSRLNTLTALYTSKYPGSRPTVLKAWTPFPDPNLSGDVGSLHYEGRTVQIRLPSDSHYPEFLRLSVEAAFDWVLYADANLVRLSVIPTNCERNIDCVFIVDQSGSVGDDNYAIALRFINNVVSFFNIGFNQTRVGFIGFSHRAHIEFDLDEYTNLVGLQDAIGRVRYRKGGTNTGRALQTAIDVLNTANNYGARPDADGIPKIAILITDGHSSRSERYLVNLAAPRLRNSGVQVYSIGVSNYNLNELRLISSDPDDEHVFLLRSYNDALGFVDSLSVTTCESQAIVQPCVITTSTVQQNILTYFQSSCSTSSGTSFLVELVDLEGSSFLYCSAISTNPGPLTSNTVANDTRGVTRRQCLVTLSSSSDTVYIGVQGQAVGVNVFSLVTMDLVLDVTSVNVTVMEGDNGNVYDLAQHATMLHTGGFETSIIDGNDNNVFSVTNMGRIQIQNRATINFNDSSVYTLSVSIRKVSSNCDCARIVVQVRFVNNQIKFEVENLPDVNVPENIKIGHEIVTIKATTKATYSIVNGNVGNAFQINSASGVVQVSSPLDFENNMRYTLTIQADMIGTPASGTIDQTITVDDVNEQPFFVTPCATDGCTFSVNENDPTGTFVGVIEASDPDLATLPNGMVFYRIDPLNTMFDIDSNGRITTRQILNRERRQTHPIQVLISDICLLCAVDTRTSVRVIVNDINDNIPLIYGPLQVTIEENMQNGFVVTQYSATDLDVGSNAEIEYSLFSSSSNLPFSIDPSSGVLTVSGEIDYEVFQEYTITVTATNPGTTLSSSRDVNIGVINLNDETPVFQDIFTAEVTENAIHASLRRNIVTVQATDADLESHGVVRYSILEGNVNNSLAINIVSGEISVAKNIDRESIAMFQLLVQASDLGTPQSRRATTIVTITVRDMNDNRPMFNPVSYSATLREDTNVGLNIFTVFASDIDEPGNPNSDITYSIESGNVGSVFSLNNVTGVFTLTKPLDFETWGLYRIRIQAFDNGIPKKRHIAPATITVGNVNELPPIVTGNQTINISENSPINVFVADFDASDPDKMAVTFQLGDGNIGNKFSITQVTGTIRLVRPLDYETVQQYNLEVVVSDGELDTSTYLTVIVLDENEFTPIFEGDTDFQVLEESTDGTLVGTLQAVDGDGSDINSRVTYAFTQQSLVTQYFNLDPDTGEITTNGVLDREQLTQVFVPPASRQQVSIVARDQGSPSRQSFVAVTITLVDINDNDPVFTDTTYINSLLENLGPNQVVFQLSATDADLGTNAIIQYSFTSNDHTRNASPFRLNEITGLVDTIQPLDYEKQTTYNFALSASDQGTPTRTTNVPGTLSIIDENDNVPVFTPNPYIEIDENVHFGLAITQYHATDADKGHNAQIEYSLISSSASLPFAIDPKSGVLTVIGTIDYEQVQSYSVTVSAANPGSTQSSSITTRIVVINLNDESPVFSDTYAADVLEHSSTNNLVSTVQATDADLGSHGMVRYSILEGNFDNSFTINTGSGEIRIAKDIDRETVATFQLVVQARDLGTPQSRRVTTDVRITVTDKNDNQPIFNPTSYSATLREDTPIGTTIFTVFASDNDEPGSPNSEIVYSISRGNEDSVFDIDASSGAVTLDRMLDFEMVNSYSLVIAATDQGTPSQQSQASATINVLNVNELPPTLSGNQTINISESAPVGSQVADFDAIDPDQMGVTFQLRNGNIDGHFSITGSGTIRLTSPLDFEAIQRYDLQVVVSDGAQETSSYLTVNVLDENEFTPIFEGDTDFRVLEQSPDETLVGTVQAVDADGSDINSRVTYAFTQQSQVTQYFNLNPDTGEITTNGVLDREQLTLVFVPPASRQQVSIVARDQGSPSRQSFVTVTITLVDINDNDPVFTDTTYVNSLLENLDPDQVVFQLSAIDADLGTNAVIRYSFTSGDDTRNASPFRLNEITGLVDTIQPLDHEQQTRYNFTLSASDQGTPTRTTNVPGTLSITDENDNVPVITPNPYIAINENVHLGFNVTQYHATDADSGSNSLIEYSLGSSSPFEIDPSSGVLTVSGEIDYEVFQEYSITVTATNPGATQSSSINTRIAVINLNDETPIFQEMYSTEIVENAYISTLLLTVQAMDADLGSHGVVRFSILEGNVNNSLAINTESGEISVAKNIDRESIAMFQLLVQASDLGTPQSRRATTIVTITVRDINDNGPMFNPVSYSATLREDTNVGLDIFTVFASDIDEPGNPNSDITYSIESGNVGSVFSLDNVTGVFTLTKPLDFETWGLYRIRIQAFDNGIPKKRHIAPATITVDNVNELPPIVTGNQTIYISENSPINVFVADFDASDPDIMAVTFQLGDGNIGNKFSIGQVTGTIRLVRPLDYETVQQYNLEVVVSDGELETSTYLTVIVLDENEFTPVFQGDTDFQVLEESPNGTLVGTVLAVDADGSDMKSRVTYNFTQQSLVTQYVNLDPNTGEITTNGVLDREQLTQVFLLPASRQQVSIVARDQGSPSRQSFVTVTITLVDINDNDPVFTDTTYVNSLLENLGFNQVVFQLSATDADLGTNAIIRYSFTLNENNGNTIPFRVNEITGRIETTQPLDCELQSSYNFTLTVSDQGTPSRTNSVSGVLNVIDENDNDPVFTMNPYTVTVLESVETDSSISTVEATDADKGLNGEVVYSVINTNSLSEVGESVEDGLPFLRINDRTGELRLDPQTIFNYEREQRVNVTVIATDKGVPRRTGTAQVVFIIMNVDEQPPSFREECSFIVPEDTPVNQVFAQCNATDSDNIATSDRDVLIFYSIFSGNDDQVFTIDNSTGEISLTKEVNREVEFSYSLSIRATDLSGRSSFQDVDISVSDSNDNAPQYTSAPYSYDFTTARIQNHKQELITIVATDQDVGQNAEIVYSIRLVTRNDDRITILEIVASDQGSPAMSTSTNLTINFERNCLLQEYSIGQSNGSVSAHVLCGIEIRPSLLNVSLGNSGTFRCNVLYNGDLTYQWIHNGSIITQPTKAIDKENVLSYTITDARFDDGGDYTCKATTSAGSLQAVAATANVQVRPIITVPPRDQAAKAGEEVMFTCSAIGIPQPTIEWYFKDTEKIQVGSRLVVSNVDSDRVGTYTCTASNDDGASAVSHSQLRLYDADNVVELSLSRIGSSNEGGICHYIDYNAITATIRDLTALSPTIINMQGSNLCEVSPCMPSPCQNGGSCELNDKEVGGYQCTCGYGYTGRNCTLDIKECSESPCENGGSCVEKLGGYQCVCINGVSGNRCQYQDICGTTSNCTEGSLCLDTAGGGYVCVQRPDQTASLVVSGLREDPGFLSDILQSYLEQQLASSVTSGRRKRQTNPLRTFCEPRLSLSTHSYTLIWLCPDGETAPTGEQQAILCTFFLNSGYVQTCKAPNGEVLEATTMAPLPNTTATISIILFKPGSSSPLDALLVVNELENVRLQNVLTQSSGIQVASISAQQPDPRVPDPGENSDSASLPAGIAVGGILGALVVAGSILIVVVGVLKYREQKRRNIYTLNNSSTDVSNNTENLTMKSFLSVGSLNDDDDDQISFHLAPKMFKGESVED